jgi:hypothetical protein
MIGIKLPLGDVAVGTGLDWALLLVAYNGYTELADEGSFEADH